MCGKYSVLGLCSFMNSGSPPHVREVLIPSTSLLRSARITPACAGSTKEVFKRFHRKQDHPRMCGKYSSPITFLSVVLGSPPHVREVLSMIFNMCLVLRITPACAGSTAKQQAFNILTQDHPRMCGKYLEVLHLSVCIEGSPPHVREVL